MEIREFMEMIRYNKGKTLALLIAVFYVLVAMIAGPELIWIRVLIFLLLPLACIFFGDAMGGYTGISRIGIGPRITRSTPGCFMVFAGWLLLLMPMIIAAWMTIVNR